MFYRLSRVDDSGWVPTYFLAALGAGGLSVSFFMWLMFWLPHPGAPVPLFEDAVAALADGGLLIKLAVLGAWTGVALFSALHIHLLVWNLRQYARFRSTPAYQELRNSNSETQLLAGPLTVAMSINVGFILGLTFVPGLWSVVEWLFPLALVAFVLVGYWALALLRDFWGRVLVGGGFDCVRNNNLGQLMPAFASAMIAVGLAAPAAMSQNTVTVAFSLVLSSFFMVLAFIIGGIQVVLGFRAMLEQGADPSTAPSLWIVVPILTTLSITLLRQTHGLHGHFESGAGGVEAMTMLITFLSAQLVFGLLGWVVLSRYGYFGRFVTGTEKSAGAYALVCPGVALTVMVHFFINAGLVGFGALEQFSAGYWALTIIALVLQAVTIWLVLRLNRLHFGGT
ncbi:TsoY family (seleno)protein [Marinobacter sp.]|uniref:TsoY family (seleno)protein n=1 Tax=Marinobacter sp. TaxID=50741 RepID=UPI0035656D16